MQPVPSDANQSVLVVWVADRQSLGIATIDTDDVRRKFGYHLGMLPGLHIGLWLLHDKQNMSASPPANRKSLA
jgi:hypothetical protein